MEFLVLLVTGFSGYQSCKFARALYTDGYKRTAVLVGILIALSIGLLLNGLSAALRQ